MTPPRHWINIEGLVDKQLSESREVYDNEFRAFVKLRLLHRCV
jgi:hypothetical protein